MVASIKLLECSIEESQNQSAMEINNLPLDLVEGILCRLNFNVIPYITDITIEDKTRILLYTSNNINNKSLGNLKLGPLKRRDVEIYTEVISSSFLKLVLLYQPSRQLLYLHNPSTDEFMTMPKNNDQEDFYIKCVGLGRVESTQEYKVVRVVENSRGLICEVFTLGTDYQWRKVADPPIYIYSLIPSIFVAGGMYMFNQDYSGIIRFDIEGENWMKIPRPENFQWYLPHWTIREVDGLVCMTGNDTKLVCMWVLKDYAKGVWALEKRINIDYNFRKFLKYDVRGETLIYPLSFNYGEGKMLLMFCNPYMTIFLSYDPITLHVEQLPQLPNPLSPYIITATFFTESFESLL